MKQEILQAINLTTGYISKDTIIVHKNMNFSILKAQFISLIGHNGSGKSTLFKTITSYLPSISGQLFLFGKEIKDYTAAELAQKISIVVTDPLVNSNLKVIELIETGRFPYISWNAKLSKTDKEIISESIFQVGMQGFEYRKINTLSDGELQRILIARALCQKTEMILLDEPLSHLDVEGKYSIMKLLTDLSKIEQKTILLSTHEIDLALQTTDSMWLLDKERNLHCGNPTELIDTGIFSSIFENDHLKFDEKARKFVFGD